MWPTLPRLFTAQSTAGELESSTPTDCSTLLTLSRLKQVRFGTGRAVLFGLPNPRLTRTHLASCSSSKGYMAASRAEQGPLSALMKAAGSGDEAAVRRLLRRRRIDLETGQGAQSGTGSVVPPTLATSPLWSFS